MATVTRKCSPLTLIDAWYYMTSHSLYPDFCAPTDKLFRYRCYNISYNNGECTGEVILLCSQQYCNRFLTGHTGAGPSQWTVDARVSLHIKCMSLFLNSTLILLKWWK